MLILSNNTKVTPSDAQVSIFSDAVMYGYGVFESMRTYPGRKLLKAEAHIHRLFKSAEQIGLKIDYDAAAVYDMLQRVVNQSDIEIQRIKILAIPDYLIIMSTKLSFDESIYSGVSLLKTIQNRSLPAIKSTSYLDCYLKYREAVAAGYYDAVLTDSSGNVFECTRSNIYWVKDNCLFTRENEVLPGITRDLIREISPFPFEFSNGTFEDLTRADEVFISNSIIGIVPVVKIDRIKIARGNPGKNTIQLQKVFNHYITSL